MNSDCCNTVKIEWDECSLSIKILTVSSKRSSIKIKTKIQINLSVHVCSLTWCHYCTNKIKIYLFILNIQMRMLISEITQLKWTWSYIKILNCNCLKLCADSSWRKFQNIDESFFMLCCCSLQLICLMISILTFIFLNSWVTNSRFFINNAATLHSGISESQWSVQLNSQKVLNYLLSQTCISANSWWLLSHFSFEEKRDAHSRTKRTEDD